MTELGFGNSSHMGLATTTRLWEATRIDSFLVGTYQASFDSIAIFYSQKLLNPNPPLFLGQKRDVQATGA